MSVLSVLEAPNTKTNSLCVQTHLAIKLFLILNFIQNGNKLSCTYYTTVVSVFCDIRKTFKFTHLRVFNAVKLSC